MRAYFARRSIAEKTYIQATVAALGILSDEKRLYAARPILISGDCKKETGPEHLHNVVKPTIDGVNSKRDLTGLRIVSSHPTGKLDVEKPSLTRHSLAHWHPNPTSIRFCQTCC